MLFLCFLLLNGAWTVGSLPEGPTGSPENITIQIIDSKTVEVFWSTTWGNVERYDVTYNPAEDRVVTQAAGNSHSVILRELQPNTQYQVTVTAVINGKSYKSRRFVFKTANTTSSDFLDLESVKPGPTKPTNPGKSLLTTTEFINPDPTAIGSKYTPQTSTTVRGVEIGLVLLALVVWIIAIALFFHRWGKIRMLLPYQPDYKTQQSLKVPGTGSVSGRTGTTGSQGQQEGPGCVQHLRWSSRDFDERSAAKKSSTSKWTSGPSFSSVVFPASPSYVRTSLECDSPRRFRHVRSQNGAFPAEAIPLCQVTQPRRDDLGTPHPVPVPAISTNVNERVQARRRDCGRAESDEPRVTLDPGPEDSIIIEKCERSRKNNSNSLPDNRYSSQNVLNVRYVVRGGYQVRKSADNLAVIRDDRSDVSGRQTPISARTDPVPLPPDEPGPVPVPADPEPTRRHPHHHQQEKPKRYSRSSLRKQKRPYYDDRDLDPCQNVPTPESNGPDPAASQQPDPGPDQKCQRRGNDPKTAEMRRKTFLRKISLQDTYLNYNQDYWLDFRKSTAHIHKSIDLGCFRDGDFGKGGRDGGKTLQDRGVQVLLWPEEAFPDEDGVEPGSTATDRLSRCDSDPLIFTDKQQSQQQHQQHHQQPQQQSVFDVSALVRSRDGSCEFCSVLTTHSKLKRDPKKRRSSWFLLPSNDNIPLFSNRNGLIETDFDVFDDFPDEELALITAEAPAPGTDAYGPQNGVSFAYSNFCEIKLTNSTNDDSDGESNRLSGGSVYDFAGDEVL